VIPHCFHHFFQHVQRTRAIGGAVQAAVEDFSCAAEEAVELPLLGARGSQELFKPRGIFPPKSGLNQKWPPLFPLTERRPGGHGRVIPEVIEKSLDLGVREVLVTTVCLEASQSDRQPTADRQTGSSIKEII
jgi:hypothetical protein